MALQFPADPVANPTYEYNGVEYVWETDHWIINSNAVGKNYVEYDADGNVTLTGNLTVNGPSISGNSAVLSANLNVAGNIDND